MTDRERPAESATPSASPVIGEEAAAPAPFRGRRGAWRLVRRLLAGFGVLVLLLVAAGVAAYSFGTMQTPSPEIRAAYARQVEAGIASPSQSRFHIPIPGCVCHSPDPGLQVAHSTIYIRECSECH